MEIMTTSQGAREESGADSEIAGTETNRIRSGICQENFKKMSREHENMGNLMSD
jgi:hypothetical protein